MIVPSASRSRAAVGDGDGLPALRLADDAVLADEEAPLGDVGARRWRSKRDADDRPRSVAGRIVLGQLANAHRRAARAGRPSASTL